MLVQRWKAVEAASVDGSWLAARHQELIPTHDVSLTNDVERVVALRAERDRLTMEELMRGNERRHRGGDGRPRGR